MKPFCTLRANLSCSAAKEGKSASWIIDVSDSLNVSPSHGHWGCATACPSKSAVLDLLCARYCRSLRLYLYTARRSFASDLACLHPKRATGTFRTESLLTGFVHFVHSIRPQIRLGLLAFGRSNVRPHMGTRSLWSTPCPHKIRKKKPSI